MLNPETVKKLIIMLPALLLSLTAHEYAHGWMAWRLGDDTAKRAGRLSLNPLVHIDPVGALVLLVTGLVGWAKPVPINPGLFRRRGRDTVLVALAGPLSNLALMVLLIVSVRLLIYLEYSFIQIVGSARAAMDVVAYIMRAAALNLGLAFFNLLPIPPLDGYMVVSGFLPASFEAFRRRFQILFLVVLVILIQSRFFDRMLGFVFDKVFYPFLP
jgi:Zn-dependent protease